MKRSKDTSSAKDAVGRRDFLKLASTAAPAAIVAATAGTGAEAAQTAATPDGLQDNAHTRTYYQLARF